MRALAARTLVTTVLGVAALAALLLVPAGTVDYWQAWLFIVVFSVSSQVIGVYLSIKDPVLLERRKKFGPAAEQSLVQRIIISLVILGYLGMMLVSALDHRFGWSSVPPLVPILGDGLVALGLAIDLVVLRVNRFAGSSIEVADDQTVVSSGPYAVVRHPMYAGALVMAIGTPLALGSWVGLLVMLVMLPVLGWRILDEETVLKRDLRGYLKYTDTVRYRLVPGVW